MRGEDDVVEVALDEGPGHGPEGGGGDPWQARRRRRGLAVVGLVAVVALGAASAVLTAQDERRERARREALAGVAGLLPPLEAGLGELWHVADGVPFAVGNDVVILEAAGELRGLDLRTGDRVWTRPVGTDETCVALSDDAGPTRPLPGDAVADRVACYRSFSTVEGYRVVVGDPAEVEVLDVGTGARVGTVPTPADVLGVEQDGRDVLVASLDADRAVVVSRWELGASAGGPARRVWRTRLPEPLEVVETSGWVFHAEAEVVRAGVVGSVPLDLVTGEPRPDTAHQGVLLTEDVPLPGGGRVEWDRDVVGRATGATRVVGADGGVVEIAGVPWRPGVQDVSSPDVLLLRRPTSLESGDVSGELVAVDATTGEDLWSAGRMAGMQALVRVDDVVVAAGAGTVLALDVRGGDLVWEDSRSGASPRLGGLTDGDVVLVAEASGAQPAMVARDLRTGAERWRVALAEVLPDEAHRVVPTSAGILVLSWDGGATMLGAP